MKEKKPKGKPKIKTQLQISCCLEEQDVEDALGEYVRQYDALCMDYLESICKKNGVYDALKNLRMRYGKYERR